MRLRIDLARPWDLAAVGGVQLLGAILVVADAPLGVRGPLALLMVLFCPGYATLSVLFPRVEASAEAADPARRLPILQRLGLSFAVGAAVSAVLGVLNTILVWGLTLQTAVWVGTGYVVSMAATGAWRQITLNGPVRPRYWEPLKTPEEGPHAGGDASRYLPVAILLLLLSAAFLHGALREEDDGFTSLVLLGQDELPLCYPTAYLVGGYVVNEDEAPYCPDEVDRVYVALSNHEGSTVDYLVRAVWFQQDENGSVESLRQTQWTTELPHRSPTHDLETRRDLQSVREFLLPRPPFVGDQVLSFLLYRIGEDPIDVAAPYAEVHLQIFSDGSFGNVAF